MSDDRLKPKSRSQIREAEHHRAVILEHVQFHTAYDTYAACSRSEHRNTPGTFAYDVVTGFRREEEAEAQTRRAKAHVLRYTAADRAADEWEYR